MASPQEEARLAQFSDESKSMVAQTNRNLFKRLAQIGIQGGDKDARLKYAKEHGVDVTSFSLLSERQAQRLISALDAQIDGE
jgi:hypothetical protein